MISTRRGKRTTLVAPPWIIGTIGYPCYQMLLAKLNRLLGVFGHGPIDEEGQTKSMID
jgi:hypothetical protein